MGMGARIFHVTCKEEMKMTHVSDFGDWMESVIEVDIPEQKPVWVNDASILDASACVCVKHSSWRCSERFWNPELSYDVSHDCAYQ